MPTETWVQPGRVRHCCAHEKGVQMVGLWSVVPSSEQPALSTWTNPGSQRRMHSATERTGDSTLPSAPSSPICGSTCTHRDRHFHSSPAGFSALHAESGSNGTKCCSDSAQSTSRSCWPTEPHGAGQPGLAITRHVPTSIASDVGDRPATVTGIFRASRDGLRSKIGHGPSGFGSNIHSHSERAVSLIGPAGE